MTTVGREKSRDNMTTENMTITKPGASRYVNAVCVEVQDMGVTTTKFGKKPMVKFTFEIDEVNKYGSKRRLTRMFHKHFHPMSALSAVAKSWCDRDLAAEEESAGEVDLESFVDVPACIKIEPGNVKDGVRYENIVEVLALNDDEVKSTCEPEDND